MAINKKLIHFNSKENFDDKVANNEILDTSIVFVKDSKEIWTHGNLYKSVNWSVLGCYYNMIDLGLPSGLLWADRNIGATSPGDAGLYFQWGDVVGYTAEQIANGEKVFHWSNYFDTTDNGATFNKYHQDGSNEVILESSDDAATVNMGPEYRMPTKEDFNELVNNCSVTFVVQDNEYNQDEVQSGDITADTLKGVKFTGNNGNSIFIPFVGMAWQSNIISDYFGAWAANLGTNEKYGRGLIITPTGQFNNILSRPVGLSVRAVKSNNI